MKPGGSVPSPCISVCTMDAHSGLCKGCMRTLEEIAAWSVLDDLAKRRIWKLLPARRSLLEQQRFDADGSPAP